MNFIDETVLVMSGLEEVLEYAEELEREKMRLHRLSAEGESPAIKDWTAAKREQLEKVRRSYLEIGLDGADPKDVVLNLARKQQAERFLVEDTERYAGLDAQKKVVDKNLEICKSQIAIKTRERSLERS